MGFFHQKKKLILWEKPVGIRREGEKGNISLSSFVISICFPDQLNRVHLPSIASQKTDREKALFLRRKQTLSSPFQRKLLVTMSHRLRTENSLRLKWFGFFYVLLPALTTHKGKEKRRRAHSLHKKIPATKGPFLSRTDYKVSLMTISRVCSAL